MPDISIYKAVAKGLLTFLPGAIYLLDKKKQKSRHSGSHSEFCYSLWLSILVLLKENGLHPELLKVGEIGSGGSLGVGICALLSGSEKYYTLETDVLFDKELNLKILDEIVILLRNKTVISDQYKQLNIKINKYEYPDSIINPLFLQDNIIAEIKNDIETGFINSKKIVVVKNWEKADSLNLDFVFSRAVMEHVAEPEKVYQAINNHLQTGSYMLHDIEYHSHGLTKKVDGHYSIPSFLWKIIFGKRKYFMNRWKNQDHIRSISDNGFKIVNNRETYQEDTESGKQTSFGAVVIAKKMYG